MKMFIGIQVNMSAMSGSPLFGNLSNLNNDMTNRIENVQKIRNECDLLFKIKIS